MLSSLRSGRLTYYSYDLAGKLETITLPGTRTISYTYTASGKVEDVTDNLGNRIKYYYDAADRRERQEIISPDNEVTTFTYYEFEDNGSGRISKIYNPDNTFYVIVYDEVGNIVNRINTLQEETTYGYDDLKRLKSILEPDAVNPIVLDYDNHDNQKTVTDSKVNSTQFVYDDFGNATSRTSPDTGTTTYAYDLAGNMITETKADNTVVSYEYDALNRLTAIDLPLQPDTVVMTYDQGDYGKYRLTGVVDPAGSTTYSYNSDGQVVTELRLTEGLSLTTQYHYSATTGELDGITYPSGLQISYQRDSVGNIAAINVDSSPLISSATYLPMGPLAGYTYGNNLDLQIGYDNRYNVTSFDYSGLSLQFKRDTEGRVWSVVGAATPTNEAVNNTLTYETGSNRLDAAIGIHPVEYTLDVNGNTTQAGAQSFFYNEFNQLIRVEENNTTIAEYTYDAANRRTKRVVGGTTTLFHIRYQWQSYC